ncbi:hypothetical protein GA0070563_12622 [Micromonospora carbonacea]|uniref:Uncharacterized protein n=1 Tax=Micromonospora carbonacea TaxID=47853 RepID=A0A1C5AXV7_9ACTN|nr:hypothetical protein GA0070563_12622 [Micromonospora carbonacea]
MKEQVRQTDPARYYEALGRAMAALRESQVLNGAHSLDWWPGLGGTTWEVEWQEGPFAHEAVDALLRAVNDDEGPARHPLHGLVREGDADPDRHYAHLVVRDVPVTLRALTPVGGREVLRRMAQPLG